MKSRMNCGRAGNHTRYVRKSSKKLILNAAIEQRRFLRKNNVRLGSNLLRQMSNQEKTSGKKTLFLLTINVPVSLIIIFIGFCWAPRSSWIGEILPPGKYADESLVDTDWWSSPEAQNEWTPPILESWRIVDCHSCIPIGYLELVQLLILDHSLVFFSLNDLIQFISCILFCSHR